MGLISSIAKIGVKAYKYGKRAINCAPEFILGESSQVLGKAYKAAPNGSIFSKAKVAAKTFEKHVEKLKATKGGFFTRLFKNTVSLPKALNTARKAGVRLAKMQGKNAFWGGFKGVLKGIGKKMPYIGALITIGFEIPSIVAGYKKEGIKGALKQTAGAGVELGCMAAGAAIGSCIPGVGTIIGGLIGGIVGMFARNAIAPEPSEEAENQSSDQGNSPSETEKASGPTSSTSSGSSSATESPSDSTSTDSDTTSTDTTSTTTTPSDTTTTTPYPTATGMTNPFGAGLNVPNPAMIGINNPLGMGIGVGNPFGMGMGTTPMMGYVDPTQTLVNSLLQPGENIFLKYPMGFQFQYMGL